MKNKKTLVLGASSKPNRYSFLAANRLQNKGHEMVLIGNKPDKVGNQMIITSQPPLTDIHTVTIYLSPPIQEQYYEYILSLQPQRIIFNPGTENPSFMKMAKEKGIEVLAACTLVLLSTNQY